MNMPTLKAIISENKAVSISTAVIVLSAISAAVALHGKLEDLDHLGSFFSGIAGTLALLWLIAGYRTQAHELRLQREELGLQRDALEAQRKELHQMGKYAAYEQIAHLMEQFETNLASSPEGSPKRVSELFSAFTRVAADWKELLESDDDERVHDLYTVHMATAALCEEFLNRVLAAVGIYQEASNVELLGSALNERAFNTLFYMSAEQKRELFNIPFLRPYVGAADLLATTMCRFEPGINEVELKGLETLNRLTPGIVREDALARARERVAQDAGWRVAAAAAPA